MACRRGWKPTRRQRSMPTSSSTSWIERWIDCLTMLLAEAADHGSKPVRQLRWLGASDMERLLVKWNQTDTDYPRDVPVHALFEQQATSTPKAIALRQGNQSVSYEVLNAQANQFARLLES